MIKVNSKNFLLILLTATLILGGIWYFLLKDKGPLVTPRDITKLSSQSQSDDTSAIEKDLEETDFASLDAELTDIEAELNTP